MAGKKNKARKTEQQPELEPRVETFESPEKTGAKKRRKRNKKKKQQEEVIGKDDIVLDSTPLKYKLGASL